MNEIGKDHNGLFVVQCPVCGLCGSLLYFLGDDEALIKHYAYWNGVAVAANASHCHYKKGSELPKFRELSQ